MLARKLALIAIIVLIAAPKAHGQINRRIGAGASFGYYALDSDFFGLENGLGLNISLRYELGRDVFFENSLGGFGTQGSGVNVGGFNYNLGFLAVFPVLIPHRPFVRAGIGFLTVDPITATPTSTYRPSQTTFYLTGGTGITFSIKEYLLIEAGASVWLSPYEYRIYSFDRSSVDTEDAQFTHFIFSLGVSYIF